jgi:hypothetical protein
MITRFTTHALLCSTLLTGACATIMEKDTQELAIKTTPPSQAECAYGTDALDGQLTAPGTLHVARSRKDIDVRCTDAVTGSTGEATIASGIEPWFWGNILIGGLLGVGVDFSTGNAWYYPETTEVKLGDVVETTPEIVPVEGALTPAVKANTVVAPEASPATIPVEIVPVANATPAPAAGAEPEAEETPAPKRSGVIAPVPVFNLPPLPPTRQAP